MEQDDISYSQRLTERPDPIQKELLRDFSKALESQTLRATFTCGGSIPVILQPNQDDQGKLTPRTEAKVHEQRVVTKGVSIRWGDNGNGKVVSLPTTDLENVASLQQLVKDCTPATFGRGGEDVFDETYRRAGAIATDKFMTDFCPYETGIVDIVAQLLLPSISGELEPTLDQPKMGDRRCFRNDSESDIYAVIYDLVRRDLDPVRGQLVLRRFDNVRQTWVLRSADLRTCFDLDLRMYPVSEQLMLNIEAELDPGGSGWVDAVRFTRLAAQRIREALDAPDEDVAMKLRKRSMLCRGIRAELYKLNAYSASGMFKPHVDTPRSAMQIGSLVVCLPVDFEGGILKVKHQGQEVQHDWSVSGRNEQGPAIHWAAFYSDCEHEVMEVTSGHRVTLTYSLFLAPGSGLLAGQPSSLDPVQLPLVKSIHHMLAQAGFMRSGGYLDIHLIHRYPHTHPKLYHFVPRMLKGSDMALHEALFAAGLSCRLLTPTQSGQVHLTDDADATQPRLTEHDGDSDHTIRSHSTAMDVGRKFEGGDSPLTETDDEEGSNFFEDTDTDIEDGLGWSRERIVKQRKYAETRKPVVWLNQKKHKELSAAYLTYGNQSEIDIRYSSVAMIVRIPSWAARSGGGTEDDPVMLEE